MRLGLVSVVNYYGLSGGFQIIFDKSNMGTYHVKYNDRFRFHKERYRNSDDVAKLFPDDEIKNLEEKEGNFSWRDPDGNLFPIITEDRLLDVMQKEFKQLPPSFGIRKFHSFLSRKYIGIRQSDVKNFLRHNEEHSKHSHRRNISKVQVSISSAPYKIFMIDVWDLQSLRRGE